MGSWVRQHLEQSADGGFHAPDVEPSYWSSHSFYLPPGTPSRRQPTQQEQPLLYGPYANAALAGRWPLRLSLYALTLPLAFASYLLYMVGNTTLATILFFSLLVVYVPVLLCGTYKRVTYYQGRYSHVLSSRIVDRSCVSRNSDPTLPIRKRSA